MYMTTHEILGISKQRSIHLYTALIERLKSGKNFHSVLGELREERLMGRLTYEECTFCAYALGVLSCKLPIDVILDDHFND